MLFLRSIIFKHAFDAIICKLCSELYVGQIFTCQQTLSLTNINFSLNYVLDINQSVSISFVFDSL